MSYKKVKLNNKNIYLKDTKLNHLINQLRNSIYPKKDDFLNNINNIKILFGEKVINSIVVQFCPIKCKFVNLLKNNRVEEYIIFTSKFNFIFLFKLLIKRKRKRKRKKMFK